MEYTVKQGDTLAKVANQFGIRPFDLLLFNSHLTSEIDYIYPGQLLHIPASTDNQNAAGSSWEEYGPSDLEKDIPFFRSMGARVEVIGYSVMKKPIYAIVIGSGKKSIFYSAGWHANEWHTTKFLVQFLKECLAAGHKNKKMYGYDVAKWLKEVKLFAVPLVNPDGIELVMQGIYDKHPHYDEVLKINKGMTRFEHWSSNIRGVDLNHQWPAGWEREADESPQMPWSRHYSGTAPLTEPEAKAVHRLTLRNTFSYVLAFHSQGQVIYWGYRGYEPKESEDMVKRLSLASSYTPVHTADSDGGYKDWFIQETGRPGFTIEVGVGVNPLSNHSYAEIWSNAVMLALEGLTLHTLYNEKSRLP
ncbi:M14 family metallopeptidase [Alkalihalophilus pseudofirmus]|uniref:M14 family metallopeptidase n=1 Tax=Alkalihalophilus pseudofirmus TaxID=79885 RepID=UPI00259BB5FE|nr:M14 family metallopeptidase [Alkalihalophilus pseudofirmus]WEG18300.1 M14 family metallopeptidase [Alkalihalophilus pseudofirmus]